MKKKSSPKLHSFEDAVREAMKAGYDFEKRELDIEPVETLRGG